MSYAPTSITCRTTIEQDVDIEIVEKIAEIVGAADIEPYYRHRLVRGLIEDMIHDILVSSSYDGGEPVQLWWSEEAEFMHWAGMVSEKDIYDNMGENAICITSDLFG